MNQTNNAMSGVQKRSMEKDEWLTPPDIIKQLGPFDLDPCSPVKRPWDTAKIHYTINDDGLSKNWSGTVWCNPPYGNETKKWLKKLKEHGDGIALVFARTETKMFFEHVWDYADAIYFFKKRLTFHHVCGKAANNNGGAPSCLIVYGLHNIDRLQNLKLDGKIIRLT